MESKQLLLAALQGSYGMTLPLLEDLKSAPTAPPTPKGGNHAHWILGHLVIAEGNFRWIMFGEPNPAEDLATLFGRGSTPDPTASGYPPYEALMSRLVRLREETLTRLNGLNESDLDQKSVHCPEGFEAFFGDLRTCHMTMALHWMMHRGQLADSRHGLGREPMMA